MQDSQVKKETYMDAILIGNGFTSKLIEAYSNVCMMRKLKQDISDIFNKVNCKFQSFRINVESLEYTSVAAGVCGDMICGAVSLNKPITGIVYNEELKKKTISTLKANGFEDSEAIYQSYFLKYGLVYETQKLNVSNIESVLKMVNIFMQINIFTEKEYKIVKSVSNDIYYNNGNCEIKNIGNGNEEKLKKYFNRFGKIFTTNYDLILDTLYPDKNIRHLHGGFNYIDQNKKSSTKLSPKKSYLVWGINGKEKSALINKGSTFDDFDFGNFSFAGTLLCQYLNELEKSEFDRLYIFGYSGENDGYINTAITNNYNIKEIVYYTSPEKVNDLKFKFKLNEMFGLEKNPNILKMKAWDDIWNEVL